MAELSDDIHEQILVRSGVKDLTRFRCVSNSWQTLISSSRFVKKHLNHNINNIEMTGYTRINILPIKFCNRNDNVVDTGCDIVGSSNGLVCIIRSNTGILVVNPMTRQLKQLQNPVIPDNAIKLYSCCGFGYDSFVDDYKVILGFKIGKDHTWFQVLSLRSNVLKVIGDVKYRFIGKARVATLCNGALHWLMKDQNKKKVILSFDLSKEEFQEIPQPDNPIYKYTSDTKLGVIEQECLCIFRYNSEPKWVMKNYNVKQSWELQTVNEEEDNGAHYSKCLWLSLSDPDDRRHIIFTTSSSIGAPVFVESLVSPHYVHKSRNKKRQIVDGNNSRKFIWRDTSTSEVA